MNRLGRSACAILVVAACGCGGGGANVQSDTLPTLAREGDPLAKGCLAAFEARYPGVPAAELPSDAAPEMPRFPIDLKPPVMQCTGFVGQSQVWLVSASDGVTYIFEAEQTDSEPEYLGTVPP